MKQGKPEIIPRDQHNLSRAGISKQALKVLYRLHSSGYQAYLVGGGVRDLLLGREPKDFDVATDARPEQVREVFRNCRLIGRRFRLAHVHFGRDVVEVATFRADGSAGDSGDHQVQDGRILRDNVYGSLDEDAWRRDFTINALYYNIADFSLVDFTGGLADLDEGVLRLIGDTGQRYREDPVRMLRAVRFAVKLGFQIHPDSERSFATLGSHLLEVPPARLYEEVLKLFLAGYAVQAFEALRHHGLFGYLFPDAERELAVEENGFPHTFLVHALEGTDARVADGKPVTPAFLFAALLWEPVRQLATARIKNGATPLQAFQEAGNEIVARQVQHIAIPRRFTLPMREIWTMQPRFERRSGKRPARLLGHPRFRAAYDFLLVRGKTGEVDAELVDWWTEFQSGTPSAQPPRTTRSNAPRRRRRKRAAGV